MEILDNKPIDIVTLTHNRMQFAAATIWSIINYTDYPYRIIVVDNGSTDGTKEWLIGMKAKGFIHELILNDKNLGIAEAKNQGMELVNWDSSRRNCKTPNQLSDIPNSASQNSALLKLH